MKRVFYLCAQVEHVGEVIRRAAAPWLTSAPREGADLAVGPVGTRVQLSLRNPTTTFSRLRTLQENEYSRSIKTSFT